MNEHNNGIAKDADVDMVALLGVLWRYKWLVAGVALLCALLAVWLAMVTPFVYRAEVTITPVAQNDNGLGALGGRLGSLAGLAGVNLPQGSPTQEAQAVLRSRQLAETFIANNKLEKRILGASAKQSLWLAVDKFRQTALSFRNEKENGTTIVAIQWKDATEAAAWANAYVALANETLRTRALEDSSRNIKFLHEQIAKTAVVEIQKVMFGLVENETKNLMLANTRTQYAFNVVDPAVTPESRIWPRRGLMVITGGTLGLVFGALLALLVNFWRRHRESLTT
jgi:uncharacterized protein involved in exopolysaccharide biosynthesis